MEREAKSGCAGLFEMVVCVVCVCGGGGGGGHPVRFRRRVSRWGQPGNARSKGKWGAVSRLFKLRGKEMCYVACRHFFPQGRARMAGWREMKISGHTGNVLRIRGIWHRGRIASTLRPRHQLAIRES